MSSKDGASAMEVDQPDVVEGQNVGVNGSVNGMKVGSPKSPSKFSSPSKLSDTSTNSSFINYGHEDTIVDSTFVELMEKMRSKHYDINVDKEELICTKCRLLFERDYHIKTVTNNCITDNYPKEIIIPVARKDATEEENPMNFDANLYTRLVTEASVARLRSRVVAPTILFDKKFICRSGTLTVWLSAVYEIAKKSQPASESPTPDTFGSMRAVSNVIWKMAEVAYNTVQLLIDPIDMEKLLATDVKVLEHLKVERICDLMVEYNKHFKQQVNVSSTEKVHEDIYKGMKMEEMPYPGCEFFAMYCEADRKPDGLVFDWSQSDVTRTLELAGDHKVVFPQMNIQKYKEWDLVQLTQNYLKIMLSYLITGTGGMVVHCISGWDRTPLFISLLRLSLWADGVIHESLEPNQMAYLTVAYDWFLFGHNLPDRIQKSEEVMHFTFNFLQYITSDEFSVTRMFKDLPAAKKGNREFQKFEPGRRVVLNKIRAFVLEFYNECITKPAME